MRTTFGRKTFKYLVLATLLLSAFHGFADDAVENLDATAFGTSTQMGGNFNIKVRIFRFSTPEDRKTLIDAFLSGKNAGLSKALSKMKPVGRISMPGTVGYDIAYAIKIDTPTGRKIRFVTDRKILFGEAYHSTRSKDYDLTAGEIDINDQDKSKSSGVLVPAARLVMTQDEEVQMELFKNPWRLANIIDWNKKTEK